ncbi:flagellar biosynthetic protein FliO [Sedimenticola hydrogenitrophicus]|uniref:flagellar biosynthetic protein FliO n=1 Tax=Sedimenticola hydrogenitrophicus TaxID=2967975 RepID=UPI0021A523E6|nr:flagellar biosynthetic protein FliO [Sedimenticola hydrogenitrophicus]
MRWPLILTGLQLLLVPLIAPAEAERPAAPALAPSPLGGGVLLETAGGLVLILALIFALGWLLRRYGRLPMSSKGEIAILSGVSLGPRERAVLLRVGTTRLLVGVAPGRVQTLHVLEEGEATDETDERFAPQLETALAERKK